MNSVLEDSREHWSGLSSRYVPAKTPNQRRILQAFLYEAVGVALIGPALSVIFSQELLSTIVFSIVVSAIALVWNYLFNFVFELWESRQIVKGRSLKRRLVHGVGFEGGLAMMLVPLTAWWLDITLLNAFVVEIGILAFFFVYAVAFTWTFDQIFGLPQSAKGDRKVYEKSEG